MNNKKYGVYEVLLGVFDNFLIDNKIYNHNEEEWANIGLSVWNHEIYLILSF